MPINGRREQERRHGREGERSQEERPGARGREGKVTIRRNEN